MNTKLLLDKEPVEAILAGAEKMYKAVSTTMGPKGHNVIFRKAGKKVGVTHDGVTVAKMVALNDETEDVGADLLREAAMKLDSVTGDGTTTVTVLTYHILKQAVDLMRTDGKSPMVIRRELDSAVKDVIAAIDEHTEKNVKKDQLIQVASLAAGDKSIGESVGSVLYDAGADTPVMLGYSDIPETLIETINGFKINSGPASPYLMTAAKEIYENVKIIVIDAKLRDKEDILPILKTLAPLSGEERNILLVVSDISGDALSYAVMNHLKHFASIAVCRVPRDVNSHSEFLQDVALACGAEVMTRNGGAPLHEPSLEYYGFAEKVTVQSLETVIVNGRPSPKLEKHIKSLQNIEKTGAEAPIRKFAGDRVKQLQQKVINIRVGGQSDTDSEERYYRYEDAVGASRAALKSGTTPGGGVMLFAIAKKIDNKILSNALKQPLLKVTENAGISVDEDAVDEFHGYDVMNPEYGVVNMREHGIIDPAQSEKECVATAAALAGLLMTSGAMIVDVEGDKKNETEQ